MHHRIIHARAADLQGKVLAPRKGGSSGRRLCLGIGDDHRRYRVELAQADPDRNVFTALLRATRGSSSMMQVARDAAISVETLRKIETGRIPTLTFFTIAALADVLDLSPDDVASTRGPAGAAAAAS